MVALEIEGKSSTTQRSRRFVNPQSSARSRQLSHTGSYATSARTPPTVAGSFLAKPGQIGTCDPNPRQVFFPGELAGFFRDSLLSSFSRDRCSVVSTPSSSFCCSPCSFFNRPFNSSISFAYFICVA